MSKVDDEFKRIHAKEYRRIKEYEEQGIAGKWLSDIGSAIRGGNESYESEKAKAAKRQARNDYYNR